MSTKKSVLMASVVAATLGMSAAAVANTTSTGAFAVDNNAGFVVGIQGGYADEHWDNLSANSSIVNDTGFAARGFVGYYFNQFLGMETGYTYLPKSTTDGVSGDIKNYAVDLLAKLSVPVSNVFNLYAKAGAGYLNSKITTAGADQTNTHIGPAFGVGAAYQVVPNLAIDVSWMRYSGQGHFTNGTSSDYQPSPDAVFLGVSYKFPARYS